jgi:hypothetical protein
MGHTTNRAGTAPFAVEPLESRTLLSTTATGYLIDVMDQFHRATSVYTDADAAGNHFAVKGLTKDAWAGPSVATMNEASTSRPHAGTQCIKCAFNPGAGSWGGFYFLNGVLEGPATTPQANWGDRPDAGVDLTGATRLTFWARGQYGGERVRFFAFGAGSDGQPYPDSSPEVTTGFVTLSKSWRQYTIALTGKDLSYVLAGFGWVTNAVENDGKPIRFYLDDISYDKPRLDEPRLLQSYRTIAPGLAVDQVMRNAAYVYDNALALMAFIARGDKARSALLADALVYAQTHDRYYADGRLRNAYQAGDLASPPGWAPNGRAGAARMPGWTTALGEWVESDGFAGTSTGNIAWAMMALLRYYQKWGGSAYLGAAKKMGLWVEINLRDTRGAGGYMGGFQGFEPGPVKQTWKSTEHNIDLLSAFKALYKATGNAAWSERAARAKKFVMAMWDAAEGKFWTGTDADGVTINKAVLPLDIQAWGFLALGSAKPDLEAALDYADDHLRAGDGFDYNDDLDGVWYEGSAQMALAFRRDGRVADADDLLTFLQSAQGDDGALPAADIDGLTTGFGWEYFHRNHVGATAWLALAQRNYNPF